MFYSRLPTYIVCTNTQYIKPSKQIRRYDAEDMFEFLNSLDQEIMIGHHVEFPKQSALEEVEEPEPKERPMTVLKLTELLGLTEDDIKVFEDTDWNE
jgi:hypothetical protein